MTISKKTVQLIIDCFFAAMLGFGLSCAGFHFFETRWGSFLPVTIYLSFLLYFTALSYLDKAFTNEKIVSSFKAIWLIAVFGLLGIIINMIIENNLVISFGLIFGFLMIWFILVFFSFILAFLHHLQNSHSISRVEEYFEKSFIYKTQVFFLGNKETLRMCLLAFMGAYCLCDLAFAWSKCIVSASILGTIASAAAASYCGFFLVKKSYCKFEGAIEQAVVVGILGTIGTSLFVFSKFPFVSFLEYLGAYLFISLSIVIIILGSFVFCQRAEKKT